MVLVLVGTQSSSSFAESGSSNFTASVNTVNQTGNASYSPYFSQTRFSNLTSLSGGQIVCSSNANQSLTGILAQTGGEYVATNSGSLLWCGSNGIFSVISTPPAHAFKAAYDSLNGVNSSTNGLVIALVSHANKRVGLWLCYNASPSGCKSKSTFYTLPLSFCNTFTSKMCAAEGAVLDDQLNLLYADPKNAIVGTCLYSTNYQTCSVFATLSDKPWGIAVWPFSNYLWVSDSGCKGYVWAILDWTGYPHNASIQYTLHDSLQAMSTSVQTTDGIRHLFVGDTGTCTKSPARVVDLTNSGPLNSPFTSPGSIPGISTSLTITTGSSQGSFLGKVIQQVQTLPLSVSSLTPGAYISGVVSGAGGVFYANWGSGELYHWDSVHGTTALYWQCSGCGGYGIAAASTGSNSYRVAVSDWINSGIYYCNNVTATSVGSCSGFITIDPSFCSTMPVGYCNPDGMDFDKSLNLYYVDSENNVEVELTAASGYTHAILYRTFPAGDSVVNIFIDQTNLTQYVTDNSCAGHVYANGKLIATLGQSLEGVTISSQNPENKSHLYVALDGYCITTGSSSYPKILDLTDGHSLATWDIPSSSATSTIAGISTNLYFSVTESGAVWETQDTW